MILAEAEEGLELGFLVEDPDGGADESEEEEDQYHLGTLGTGLLDGDGGTLDGGEGRGLLLHLRLGSKELGRSGVIGVVLQLHLVLEVGLLGTDTLEDQGLVGIDKLDIELTGMDIALTGLTGEFLVVLEIDTGLLGAVVGDELLEALLDTVGHDGTDQRILILDIDGDHHGLLVDIAVDPLVEELDNLGLGFRQLEGIELVGLFFLTTEETADGLTETALGTAPPRTLLLVLQIVVVGHHTGGVLLVDLNGEQRGLEIDGVHQIGIERREQGLGAATEGTAEVDTEGAGQGSQTACALRTGELRGELHSTTVVVGDAQGQDAGDDKGGGKHLVIETLVLLQSFPDL